MILNVPLDQVDDNPFQRRQDYGDVAGLAADILARGLLQVPRGRLVCTDGTPLDETGLNFIHTAIDQHGGFPRSYRVQLAFGHRRLRAFVHIQRQQAGGWGAMPVYVEALTDDQMLDAVWSENQHRSDINPIEQAELLAEKVERARAVGGNQTTVAAEWGLDRSTVANKIRLLELPAEVQAAVRQRKLSERQALALLPVIELERKIGDQPIEWSKDKEPTGWGKPIAPAHFINHAVANPNKVTSDAIRSYTRQIYDETGRELPDYLAIFDSGGNPTSANILQPLCAGCPFRHNQHCLNRECFDAKFDIFQSRIPDFATEVSGLPWSDEESHFSQDQDRDLAVHLRHLYGSGHRDNLVVGWVSNGWRACWLSDDYGYKSPSVIQKDWREGLLIGHVSDPNGAASVPVSEQPPLPVWRMLLYDDRDARKQRVKDAFVAACEPLVNHFEALRPLLALLNPVPLKKVRDPAELIATVVERHYQGLYLRSRDEMAEKLTEAGIAHDCLDPVDDSAHLCVEAASALLGWYEARDTNNARAAAELERVGEMFSAAGVYAHNEDQSPELRELARWLEIARTSAAESTGGK